jgi:hypothetical protein
VFSTIFNPKIARNQPFFDAVLVYFGRQGAYLPQLTPSTTTACPGTPPANSWHIKEFLSCL